MTDSANWIFLIELTTVIMIWFLILEFNDGFGREEDIKKLVRNKIFSPTSSKTSTP